MDLRFRNRQVGQEDEAQQYRQKRCNQNRDTAMLRREPPDRFPGHPGSWTASDARAFATICQPEKEEFKLGRINRLNTAMAVRADREPSSAAPPATSSMSFLPRRMTTHR